MPRDALIGATGFVGSNLCLQREFDALYNSRDIGASAGQKFDTVICAAAPGSMVEANRAAERDANRIDNIIEHLSRQEAKRLVLISTIATLSGFGIGQDESTTAFETTLAYGANRRRLEAWCETRIEDYLILRLPALFGRGLRKNLLFDLKNPTPSMLTIERRDAIAAALPSAVWRVLYPFYAYDPVTSMWLLDREALDASADKSLIEQGIEAAGFEALRFVNPASTFQFFDLSLLSDVIDTAFAAGIRVLHVAPEPISAQRVVMALRGRPMPESGARIHNEDMQTRHAAVFGRVGRYIAGEEDVLDRLRGFMQTEG